MHGLELLKSVAVALLILANAFFVAVEFALVSIRATRIEQLVEAQVPGARAARRLQLGMNELLPAVQLGVTLCSLALGWLGEPLAASILAGWLGALPQAHIWAHVVAVVLGFALITYFHVVVGELVPKSLALWRAEAMAVMVAPAMLVFMAVTHPAVRLLRNSAAMALRGFDIPITERAQVHSAEELKLIATSARRTGLLPALQEKLIHRALELDDVPVREIMTPRQKIFSLPSTMPLEEAEGAVLKRNFSRIPVYDQARGHEYILGVVYARDLAKLVFARAQARKRAGERQAAERVPEEESQRRAGAPLPDLTLAQVMRDVMVVPETKSVLELLREFQQRRRHLAIAVDEYGSVVGLVTAEDAVEQLAGEFEDEFDAPAAPMLATATGAILMDGGVNLRDLETQMQWDLPRDGGVETLAGFLLVQFGHIPGVGESIVHEGRRITVVEMDARRIARVRVEPIAETSAG
jgi:CBS domain containing-hemolysin-like protein